MTFSISIHHSSQRTSRHVAEEICHQVNQKPNSVLGLPTGNTPIETYQELVKLYQDKKVSFRDVTTFNLDEYLNLPPEDSHSYHYYMAKNLFNHVDIQKEKINILNGLTNSPEDECLNFENKIKLAGGIDLQILGIGTNGHIGFNEPGTSFKSKTGLVNLADKTIADNSAHFDNDPTKVPRQALSMGMDTIFSARKIIIIALGSKKSEIVAKLLKSKPTEDLPASLLHLHSNCELVLDLAAASLISKEIPKSKKEISELTLN